jgi:hypothetical protein
VSDSVVIVETAPDPVVITEDEQTTIIQSPTVEVGVVVTETESVVVTETAPDTSVIIADGEPVVVITTEIPEVTVIESIGDTGPMGPTGATGPQGIQGIQGIRGETGADSIVPGPQGIQGIQGIQGVQGEIGPDGPDGPQGPAGSPNTASVPLSIAAGDISIRAASNAQSGAATSAQITALESATAAQHTQGTDTTLGAMTADINANGHQVVALSVPDANGEAIRQTAKITEALLESATDLKHAAVTVSAPIALSGQALSLINNAVSPGTISAFDIGVLSAVSDLVIPTSKAVATAIGVHAALITGVHGLVITAGKTLTLTEALTLNALPIGGLAVATAANVLGSLAVGVAGQYLAGGGAGTVPTWATLNQAAVAGLKTTDAPVFGGINLGAGTLTTTEAGIVETNLTRAGLVMKNLYTGAGWARTLLNYTDDDGVVYFGMGAFGTGQAFGYLWIGPAYNNTWLKLDLDGSVAVPYGLHVGGTSPAGDNNLLVDGTGTITGAFGCNGVAAGTKSTHIADASDAATVITRCNAILVVLEKFGFVATS